MTEMWLWRLLAIRMNEKPESNLLSGILKSEIALFYRYLNVEGTSKLNSAIYTKAFKVPVHSISERVLRVKSRLMT